MTPTSSAPAVAAATAVAGVFNLESDYQFKCTVRKGDIILGVGLRSPECEIMLQSMSKKYAKGNTRVKPTAVTYNSVLNALSKGSLDDPDAPIK